MVQLGAEIHLLNPTLSSNVLTQSFLVFFERTRSCAIPLHLNGTRFPRLLRRHRESLHRHVYLVQVEMLVL